MTRSRGSGGQCDDLRLFVWCREGRKCLEQRLQDQSDRLPAARGAAVYADVRGVCRNSVCGPGCAEIVVLAGGDIVHTPPIKAV